MSCCHSTSKEQTDVAETPCIAEKEFQTQSRYMGGDRYQGDLIVPNMHCAACISRIEKSLNALPQVESARANLTLRRVMIVWNAALGDGNDVKQVLDRLGFENFFSQSTDETSEKLKTAGRQLLLALAVAGFASANIMLLSVSVWSGASVETATLFHLISGIIAVPAVAVAGRPFFSSALKALSARRLNMDVPISVAVLLALAMGIIETLSGGKEAYFDACVTLLFFLLIGRYLDHLMREKARSSVSRLAQMTSKGGLLVGKDGSIDYVAQEAIKVGQTLRVMPGERFPVDGRIIAGRTDIDRSLVTGESTSVLAEVGVVVEAGVLNLTGAVDITATTDSRSSFLAEVMKMMTAAENGRGKYVRIADRAARIYAPAVHLIALMTFLFWMVATNGEWRTSLYAAIAVLIITCPCALGLAVPVVHVIGANRLLKKGILMRDGSAFERLAEIDEVVFDKTGTLTTGTPSIKDTAQVPYEVARIIKTLSSRSSHPLSVAFQNAFKSHPEVDLETVTERAGYGIEAKLDGKIIRLGRPSWVADIARHDRTDISVSGIAFATKGEQMFQFGVSDALRDGARQAIACLQDAGLKTTILSGDHAKPVQALAKKLSVKKFRHEMTPLEKVTYLQNRKSKNRNVLMVGDGLNDAPALASAHVSIAPATASDVGRLASDFIFTRGSLSAVPFAWTISKRTKQLVQQNFMIALAYNCIAVPFAIAGQVTPLFAAIAMSLSSIVVVANSMRLNFGSHAFSTRSMEHATNKPDEISHIASAKTLGASV